MNVQYWLARMGSEKEGKETEGYHHHRSDEGRGGISGETGGVKMLFFPVKTVQDLESLSIDDIVEGYRMGLHGKPAPRENRAMWHGWRNGMMDSGRKPFDRHARELAEKIFHKGKRG